MLPLLFLAHSGAQPAVFLLESLDLGSVIQDWGNARAGKSVDGRPITIAGQVFTTGIGTHARSEMDIALGGKGIRFQTAIGVDDEVPGRGSVRFFVFLDGKQAADSGVMRGGDKAKTWDISLKGAKSLRLVVEDGGDDISYDHADWAGATIEMAPGAKPKVMVAPVEPPMKIASHIRAETEIHGPRVVGCTPGHPFLYKIPATGKGALQYGVSGLPKGLAVDDRGVISGTIAQAGQWDTTIVVKGAKGTDRRGLRIIAGKHKLAQTPPMGWNSWNVWAGEVDADKVRAAADAFLSTGLANFGYNYVNIDDCWEKGRSPSGEIMTNSKFPDMESLTDYVHSKGLKMGIYSSPGPRTCAGFEGSYGHEIQDAKTYGKWGIDYLKYDWCSYGEKARDNTLFEYQKPYILMRDGLDQANRDIVYSLCQYGMGDVYKWGKQIGGNVWRTTGDITDTWQSMSSIGFAHSEKVYGASPGGWNDPDMLVVGSVGWGAPHPTKLTPNEQITHISLWSLLAAPLIIGCDLTKIDAFTQDLLMNHEVIDIDQDPLGRAAVRVSKSGDLEVWARPLFDGTTAVGLFNRGVTRTKVTATWKSFGKSGEMTVRDVWNRRDIGRFDAAYTATVPAHGCVLVKVSR